MTGSFISAIRRGCGNQLPIEERALLIDRGIELLVPSQLSGNLPLGLLVLGPRCSAEPYNQEDLDPEN